MARSTWEDYNDPKEDHYLYEEGHIEITSEEQFVPLFVALRSSDNITRFCKETITMPTLDCLNTSLDDFGIRIPVRFSKISNLTINKYVNQVKSGEITFENYKQKVSELLEKEIVDRYCFPPPKSYSLRVRKDLQLPQINNAGTFNRFLRRSGVGTTDNVTRFMGDFTDCRTVQVTDFGFYGVMVGGHHSAYAMKGYESNSFYTNVQTSSFLKTIFPNMLIVVKAKHLVNVRLSVILEQPMSVPLSDMKVLTRVGASSNELTNLFYNHGVRHLIDNGVKHYYLPAEEINKYLFNTENYGISKEEYMKNVLNNAPAYDEW